MMLIRVHMSTGTHLENNSCIRPYLIISTGFELVGDEGLCDMTIILCLVYPVYNLLYYCVLVISMVYPRSEPREFL